MCYKPAFAPLAQLTRETQHHSALAPRVVPSSRRDFHDVWQMNFDEEFDKLLEAVSRAGGSEAILAMDMEFPGFLCQDPRFSSDFAHHQALCCNVDQLWPIQLGVAVVGTNGMNRGVWTFNLSFDATVDSHTQESVAFLQIAGMDFARHQTEGIAALAIGQRLADSSLVGVLAPCWLTFSGSYDWAYLLKLVTLGRALPQQPSTFEKVLSVYCPKRQELRDLLPTGSLEVLGRRHGVKRCGKAHTAGSDALLTLELFVLLVGPKFWTERVRRKEEEAWDHMMWNNMNDWYSGTDDAQWYSSGSEGLDDVSAQVPLTPWESSSWITPSETNDDWYSGSLLPEKLATPYNAGFNPWTNTSFAHMPMVYA